MYNSSTFAQFKNEFMSRLLIIIVLHYLNTSSKYVFHENAEVYV